jgi:murein DD-endopeptidase MepM/ murein hydrolase activator NlpD
MTFNSLNHLIHHTRERMARLGRQATETAMRRPGAAAAVLLAAGTVFGAGASAGVGFAETAHLRHQTARQQAQLEATRDQAQREVNALAARLGELQAEANRLNALGERLTRTGQLADGEFDFDKPVGVGGVGATRDMPPAELRGGLAQLESQFKASGEQLSVLESLLFNRKLDAEATPSRMPIAHSYVTSGFGGRADPFGGGAAFHKGIDFHASMGDPVLAVADGVVSYAGVRSGYGNVVEIDHGNGYVTRYAHNSRLLVRVGDLVRSGQQVAKAGSTGRSTGAHVHFEVWVDGVVVNPRKFLGQDPIKRG